MKSLKKSLSLILALLMLISFFAAVELTASAETVTKVSTWSALKAALEDGTDGTIIIQKTFSPNITTSDRVIISKGNKVLDLNVVDPMLVTARGDISFCNLFTINGGSLTIKGCAQLKYKYEISEEYASTQTPSALCYVNGGTVYTSNCELFNLSGYCVKVKKGTANIGMGSNLISQQNWAVTDEAGANGIINIKSMAYLSSFNQLGYSTQGAFEGYGALGVRSANTVLNVQSGKFGGGVQLATAEQAANFSPKTHQVSCGGAYLNYELRTNYSDAYNAGEKYYWYTFLNNDYYYFALSNSSEANHPDFIEVNYDKDLDYSITVQNAEPARFYGGYQKSFISTFTANKDDEVILFCNDYSNFEKWEIVSGSAKIEDVTNKSTTLKMGASDVVVKAVLKGGSDNGIDSVSITGIVAPAAGAKVNTFARIPDNAEYELVGGQDD
ncbi:MAG: hypothetical protein IJ725_01960, partial [Ruminococcus sp.]|nr:hypothetical protein [Ruminococcus sp.]